MQKLLKIIGMISALVLSALGLSACNRDAGAICLYGVYPEFGVRFEENEALDSGEATLGEIEDNEASSLE